MEPHKNIRLGTPMPNKMILDLTDKLGKSYDVLTGPEIIDLAIEINHAVDKLIRDEPSYKPYVLKDGKTFPETQIDQRYLSYRTLERYLNGSNAESRNLFVISCFLGYNLEEARSLILSQTQDISYKEHLSGAWNVYFHDASRDGIVRTVLWLDRIREMKFAFKVQFKTSWSDIIYTGKGRLHNDTLIMELSDQSSESANSQFVYLCAKLPSKTDKKRGDMWILNAGGIASGKDYPVIGNLVLIKNPKMLRENEHLGKSPKLVTYKERPLAPTRFNPTGEELVNQVVVYLTRHKDRPVQPFVPDKIEAIDVRNAEYHKKRARSGFMTLKRKFEDLSGKKNWYSLSRVLPKSSEIAIYEWHFTFNDARQEVLVYRRRLNRPDYSEYEGEVTVESGHLYIRMRDKDKTKRKFLIALFPREGEIKTLYGISSTTYSANEGYESSNMAVREMLFQMDVKHLKELDVSRGYIPYDEFIDFKGMAEEDKLYIARREISSLSYPLPINYKKHYARIHKARFFAGEYFAIFPNNYDHDEKSYLLTTISIDSLANVIMKVQYPQNPKRIYVYYGAIEFYSNNLHMRLEIDTYDRDQQKVANLMIDDINSNFISKPSEFSGISIDTDHEGKTGAYPFVMIDRTKYFTKKAFEPAIENTKDINDNTDHIAKIVIESTLIKNKAFAKDKELSKEVENKKLKAIKQIMMGDKFK